VGDAFAAGWSLDEVHDLTKIDEWFLVQIEEIVVKIELERVKLAVEKGDAPASTSLDALTLYKLKKKKASRTHGWPSCSRRDGEKPCAMPPPQAESAAGLQACRHLCGGIRHRIPPICTRPTRMSARPSRRPARRS
jgi:hypothetical protein